MRCKFLYKSVLVMVFFVLTPAVLRAQTSLSVGGQLGLVSLDNFHFPGPGGRVGADILHKLGPRWDFSVGLGVGRGKEGFSKTLQTGVSSYFIYRGTRWINFIDL